MWSSRGAWPSPHPAQLDERVPGEGLVLAQAISAWCSASTMPSSASSPVPPKLEPQDRARLFRWSSSITQRADALVPEKVELPRPVADTSLPGRAQPPRPPRSISRALGFLARPRKLGPVRLRASSARSVHDVDERDRLAAVAFAHPLVVGRLTPMGVSGRISALHHHVAFALALMPVTPRLPYLGSHGMLRLRTLRMRGQIKARDASVFAWFT